MRERPDERLFGIGQRLERYRPYWFEEPVSARNLDAMAEVRSKINLPIMTGVDQTGVAEKIEELIPGYMPMGDTGMGDMMDMGTPRNSLLMGAHGGIAGGSNLRPELYVGLYRAATEGRIADMQ